MPLTPFPQMMADARAGGYAVGYFEPWDLRSLLAILHGAQQAQSPIIAGQSGIFLPTLLRGDLTHFPAFARAGRLACENSHVPVCYLFNETPCWDWATASLELGFNVTMYSNPADDPQTHLARTIELVRLAGGRGVAVQSELVSLHNADGDALTDPNVAADFVRATGVDALGVAAGNRHLASDTFELDLELIGRLGEAMPVPMVLHGGSGARDDQLRQAIASGVGQVNYGRIVRLVFLECLDDALGRDWRCKDLHLLLGTGHQEDIMRAGLEAVSALVAQKCQVLGSAGKAQ